MVPQILASVDFVQFMPFVMVIAIVALVFWYLLNKKRLEHQQIMAAIEKGTPLSEIKPVELKKREINWIKSLTTGIALLLIGIGMAIVSLSSFCYTTPDEDKSFGLSIAAMVLIAIGIAGIVRGILQRKYDKAALLSDKSALDANQG